MRPVYFDNDEIKKITPRQKHIITHFTTSTSFLFKNNCTLGYVNLVLFWLTNLNCNYKNLLPLFRHCYFKKKNEM